MKLHASQREVLRLVAEGWNTDAIALKTGRSYTTVAASISLLAKRLGCPVDMHPRVWLVRWWLRQEAGR